MEEYKRPELEVIIFRSEDIITTSSVDTEETTGGVSFPDVELS